MSVWCTKILRGYLPLQMKNYYFFYCGNKINCRTSLDKSVVFFCNLPFLCYDTSNALLFFFCTGKKTNGTDGICDFCAEVDYYKLLSVSWSK